MTAIRVEVVYATPDRQELVSVELETGSTVADAIERSGLAESFAGFEMDPSAVGIFSRKVELGQALRDGDRVEIYRPLRADPKEVRRQRALLQAKNKS
ncbi:MAG: RnfH family protein [Xanthomonadales bacterium]|nr:RnfH family protein [Xanthomonadales bacterium]